MNDLSSALERLCVAFSTPTSGLGAPGPAEEEAEGLRGGFPEDHGPGEQTGLPGAGGLHTHGCSLAANHVPREFNQWADELTHPDFSGFDPLQRVPKQELCEEFVFLPRLLNGDAFDLSVGPPMLP